MNTNSNTYTVIYSAILVIVVAAVLAFAAMSLKPLQDTNVKVETISKVLVAAEISTPDAKMSNEEVMKTYSSSIKSAILVNGKGEVKGTLSTDAGNIQIYTQSDLKAQNDIIKKIQSGDTKLLDDLRLPVYIFNVNGKDIPVQGTRFVTTATLRMACIARSVVIPALTRKLYLSAACIAIQ